MQLFQLIRSQIVCSAHNPSHSRLVLVEPIQYNTNRIMHTYIHVHITALSKFWEFDGFGGHSIIINNKIIMNA